VIDRRTEVPEGILPTDDLPDGWILATAGSIADVVGGGTPKSSETENFSEVGHPWITPADLSRFRELYIRRGRRDLSEKGLRSSSAVVVPAGTVLMSSRAPIGYVAIAANDVCTNQGFKSFVCASGIDPEFVYFWLRLITPHLEQMGSGSTFTEISGSRAKEIPILLAPTCEQRRIAAQVKRILPTIDRTRDHLSRVSATLKRFRHAVLAAACSGRLTEDWRNRHAASTESVNQQLATLRRERHRAFSDAQRNYHPTRPNPTFEADVPDGWQTVSLDDLCVRITSGSRDWSRYYSDEGAGTFIMAQNVRPRFLDLSYRLRVAPPADDRDRERSQVKRSDILVTIVGANTGDICRVTDNLDQYYVCQSVALVRPADPSISPFLELYLNSPIHGQAQFRNWIYGEGRPHLSFDQLRQTAILFPPLDEQEEIGRRVKSLFALASMIENHLSAAALRADNLTQSILAKAFRGELVPTEAELARRESREYEPASVLLERIKKERVSETKPSRVKRSVRKS